MTHLMSRNGDLDGEIYNAMRERFPDDTPKQIGEVVGIVMDVIDRHLSEGNKINKWSLR